MNHGIAPLLVLGWGNRSRGDDALGPLAVERLQAMLAPTVRTQVDFLDDYQLQPEHALDIAGRSHVLLIDADLRCGLPFRVTEPLQPQRDRSFSSHALSPQALLQVHAMVCRTPLPHCALLGIRARACELGTGPSERALGDLETALGWAARWIAAMPGPPPHRPLRVGATARPA